MPEDNATHFLNCEWRESDNQTLWDHWNDCKQGEYIFEILMSQDLCVFYCRCRQYFEMMSLFSKRITLFDNSFSSCCMTNEHRHLLLAEFKCRCTGNLGFYAAAPRITSNGHFIPGYSFPKDFGNQCTVVCSSRWRIFLLPDTAQPHLHLIIHFHSPATPTPARTHTHPHLYEHTKTDKLPLRHR